MTQALVPTNAQDRNDWKALVANTIAKGQNLNANELELFATVAQHLNLDVWRREVYAIRYKGQVQFIVGIDGYLRRAMETGEYDGHDPVLYTNDGKDWSELWIGDEKHQHPLAAKVTVYRKGMRVGTSYVARWGTFARYFNGKLSETWEAMPDLMLGKCALVHALREAFPDNVFYELMANLRSEGIAVDMESVDPETGEITPAIEAPREAQESPAAQPEPMPPPAPKTTAAQSKPAPAPTRAPSQSNGKDAATRFWAVAKTRGSAWYEPLLQEHFGSTSFDLLDPDEQLKAAEIVEASQ